MSVAFARGIGYVPLDELLAMPRIRIVRTLLRFGWAEGVDIFEALGDVLHDPRVNNNYSVVLSRLVRERALKRREIVNGKGRSGGRYEYAVTLLGRVELAMAMRRTQPELELGALDDAEVA